MSEGKIITEVSELVEFAELTDIRVNETSGKRISNSPEVDIELDPFEAFQVSAEVGDDFLETTARLELDATGARLIADVTAVFTLSEKLEVSKEIMQEFVERVGIMTVYPYVREQLFSQARRLGTPAPVLGFLRAGQFSLDVDGEEAG